MTENKRTCIISREKFFKKDLFQIKLSPKWEWIIWENLEKNLFWRSIYLKKDKEIFEEFLKRPKKFLENFLKRKISDDKFFELKEKLQKFSIQ